MHQENFGPYAELLKQPGEISEADVRHLRREVFQDGLVSQLEADAVFALNDAVTGNARPGTSFSSRQ